MTTMLRQMRDEPTNAAAWAVMTLTPLFFASNIVFGRWTVPDVAPFTLAFLRWGFVALLLAPFVVRAWHDAKGSRGLIAGLALLGMAICGGGFYLALSFTTAINATLIYTTSPIFVLLIERTMGKPLSALRLLGCLVALLGVSAILLGNQTDRLSDMQLNWGDLGTLACAIAWAFYSILFRTPSLASLPAAALFGMIAGCGALILAPLALWEWTIGADMPTTTKAWTGIAGIVVFSSLVAFGGYQFGLRRFGPATTSVFMYLLPAYGVLMAVIFLGEAFELHHAVGIVLVTGGVVLATRPRSRAVANAVPDRGVGPVSS